MQKQAPSIGRIMVAVGFALSCFALLLFLWITFGGAVPFKPESYRFSADFPEAITLQKEADVRIGGVSVGKVKDLQLADDEDATRAVIEIEPQYAPISSDARAILRQKTLLGETYIELTSGSQFNGEEGTEVEEVTTAQTAQAGTDDVDVGELSGDDAAEPIEEGGHLEDTQVQEQVQIDEIFQALDEETRQSFQLWMRNAGIAIEGRGLDLNDAFGNFGPFSEDASDVLGTLREQEQALREIVRNTGDVFAHLTAREQALAGAIVGSNKTFRALASRDEALAETFRIFPTFNIESRLTLERLEKFAAKAGPLFRDLRPVARDLSPTIHDLRRLAPHLRRLFKNLGPLVDASITGLPAARRFLDQLRPVMAALDPFLANFNPIVRYLDFYKTVAADFLSTPASATEGALPPIASQSEPRHLSRQMSIFHGESISLAQNRSRTNRGNGYLLPFAIGNPFSNSQGEVFPSFDCNNTGNMGQNGQILIGNPDPHDPQEGIFNWSTLVPSNAGGGQGNWGMFAPCTIQSQSPSDASTGFVSPFPAEFGGGRIPYVPRDP
ncbi:MAG: MlaD family protein [Solirubrobacterales bacterium]